MIASAVTLAISNDSKGIVLFGLTVVFVLVGATLAIFGLRKYSEASENTKAAAQNLAQAASAAQTDSVAATSIPGLVGDASDALAEMKGPLSPARYVFALALAAFAGALVAWGLVDFTATADQDTTTITETTG